MLGPRAMARQWKNQRAPASAPPAPRGHAPLLAAFFLSGAAGVMHEVVWSRRLVALVGAEAYAQALVLAVFVGGLAVGAALFGRRADRGRPLRTYVALEALIAGYCLLLPLLLHATGAGYLALVGAVFERPGLRLGLRFVLAALTIAPPAILMGGTLPVLVRHLASAGASVRRVVGLLYACNSFGAVLGTAVAGFLALPALGTQATLLLACAANLAAGGLLWPAARREPATEIAPALVPAPARTGWLSRVMLAALFVSGFTAMGYEVLFVRVVGLSFASTAQSFTVMLICFLTGIALGGGLAGRLRAERPRWLVGLAQLGVAAAFVASTPLLARLPFLVGRLRLAVEGHAAAFPLFQAGKAALALAVLLVPTTCLGAVFPLIAAARAATPGCEGRTVGATYAWNTAGNVLGVLLTALVLLPRLGLEGAFHALWAASLLAGLVLLAVAAEVPWSRRLAVAAVALAGAALYARVGTRWSETITLVPDHLLASAGPGASADAAATREHLASFAAWKRRYMLTEARARFPQILLEHDAHNTVVAFGPDRSNHGAISLAVNNKTDASTVSDLETQMLLAHAPLFLAPQARTALVIGHGSGITTGSALRHGLERADIVEISPAVLRVDPLFANDNDEVLSDPRVHVYVDDAGGFMRAVPRSYDVIISEPSNPWIAGVGDLFTVEFFTAARRKLNPGGVFTLWFHTYAQSDETTRLIMRTLGSVFPRVEVFFDRYLENVVAVASAGDRPPNFAAMEERFANAAVRRDLDRIALPNLLALFTHHRATQQGAEALAGPGPVDTLDHERLRYEAPAALFAGTNSYFFEERDPLLRPPPDAAGRAGSTLLLDRYIAFRNAQGRPLTRADFEAAGKYAAAEGGYSDAMLDALLARAPP